MMELECDLCKQKSINIHSVYHEDSNKIVDYCEDCEEVYIDQLSLVCPMPTGSTPSDPNHKGEIVFIGEE